MKNTYQIDPAHSRVQFSVRHLMISTVRGTFAGVKGTVAYDPQDTANSSVEVEIDVNSINTNDEKRDGHLQSPDFFDAATYPQIVFKSTSIEKIGDSEFKATGDLTIHGVTNPVTLDVDEVSGEVKDPWGQTKIGATAKAKIKRSDFGLTWNAPLETGGVMVSDDVRLDFDMQFIKG